jgi:hypothetical protein
MSQGKKARERETCRIDGCVLRKENVVDRYFGRERKKSGQLDRPHQ